MLKIRLQRIGKRGQAYFRVIVVEHTKKPKGEFLELLGTYDPHLKKFNAKKERIEYWISKGAQTSPTANNLLVNYKVWDKPKKLSWKPKVKPTKDASASAPTAASEPEKPKVQAPEEPPAETAEDAQASGTPAQG
ncbi:MAG: 30S ribosomal protein S16 [Candidatus Yanofskybacteria bacterium]|nr:30S ribosomal protein S16 [Candidatus Yanofskybacteria bacterium]